MKQKVLIVEDNISLSQRQKDWLEQAGYDVMTAMREPAARALIRKHRFDFILSDVRLPEGDGISLLEWLTKEKKDIPFIVTTEYGSIPDAVRAIKLGAKDYLPKPVHREHLLELAEEIFRPLATVRTKPKDLFRRTCPKILEVERYARIVAPSDMSVLILGANGTGKESVAQGIHANSGRDGKFVAVNCGALPRELAASLLFGHEKGAFTGADTAKNGYFDMAKGGTLFLDEIGTMPIDIQSMLLRVLQVPLSAATGSGWQTCGLWRQRMKIWNGPSRKDDSGKTCTTVWQRWKSGCHLWPSVLMTFCLWRNFSVNGFPKNLRKRQKAFQKMPYTDFVLIVGRAMSGNCRTGSNGRCCLLKPLYWSCRT